MTDRLYFPSSIDASNNGCVKCPKGWKRSEDNIDLTKCVQCALGETTTSDGSTSCSFCSIGQFGSTPGECLDCPLGQYQR